MDEALTHRAVVVAQRREARCRGVAGGVRGFNDEGDDGVGGLARNRRAENAVAGKRVQPVNVSLIPSWSKVDPRLQSAPWHTVNGVHYGVPYQWGSNVLMYNTEVFKEVPKSWNIVFEAMDLPFAFADDAAFNKTIKGDLSKFLFDKLESKGIKGLAFWDNGFHMVSANKPIITPADFQGLKVRISGSKIADQYFRKLGSIPQILAFSEVYQALQTGVVDGCENTPSNYLSQKFHEVQKHITVSYHAHLQYAVIVNSKYWASLPADIRGPLEKAMNEATDYTNEIAAKENEDALKAIKDSGRSELHYLTPEQKKAWQVAMQPTWQWAEGRVGKEVIAIMQKSMST